MARAVVNDINARLKRLEQKAGKCRDDEAEFYEYCRFPRAFSNSHLLA
jgi:hypothetical protein